MMNHRVVATLFVGCLTLTSVAQEPRGWKQPLLQPTIPPKVVGGGAAPVWRVPLVHPTLPPALAGKALVAQQHQLFVPFQSTNGLRMTVTNLTVIVPNTSTNEFDLRGTNVVLVPFGPEILPDMGQMTDEEYVHRWQPELMYPTYPPKLAPVQSLGLLELP